MLYGLQTRRVTDWVARSLSVMDASDCLFEVLTPLGFRARVTAARWKLIINAKHPVMAGREPLVKTALEAPDEVRQSRVDAQVLLFYKA
jgi:hypothetical protein